VFAHLDSTNIFTNYADQAINTTGMFYDTASTALLASTVYRVSLLWNDHSHLPNAEKCRQALYATGSSGTGSSSSSSIASQTKSSSNASSSVAHSSTTSTTSPAPSASATTAPLTDLVHFTSDGWLTPVVNPHQFGVQGAESPEGEAFVLALQAAYTEWVAGGSVGANAAERSVVSRVGWIWVAGCVVVGSLLA